MDKLPITLVKEYIYCPRQAYFKLFHRMEPPTESMRYAKGVDYRRVIKNTLAALGIDEGSIKYEVPVYSRKYGLVGRVDALAKAGNRGIIVEVKLNTTKRLFFTKHRHQLAQIAAYTIAAEETYHITVSEAVVISLESGQTIRVKVTPWVRMWALEAVRGLRRMVEDQELPKPTAHRARCRACFYRNICLKSA